MEFFYQDLLVFIFLKLVVLTNNPPNFKRSTWQIKKNRSKCGSGQHRSQWQMSKIKQIKKTCPHNAKPVWLHCSKVKKSANMHLFEKLT